MSEGKALTPEPEDLMSYSPDLARVSPERMKLNENRTVNWDTGDQSIKKDS